MPFSHFEALAQRLVEGSFKRLFGGRLEPLELASRLARALEDTQVDDRAATRFNVQLHPDEYDSILREHPGLADELADYVLNLAQQASLRLVERPQVTLTPSSSLAMHQVQVTVTHIPPEEKTNTQLFQVEATAEAEVQAAITAVDAYLIIDGRRHAPLDRPLITIGRRIDNDVVLNSPTVSRRHAQIRWRYGRFVLYDLSNRRRTAVNGQPVTEHVLRPGDVISLSNVMLIYGEGRTGRRRARKMDRDDADATRQLPPVDP